MRVKLFLSHCLFLAAISFDWKKYERRLKSIHISIKSKFLNHIHLQFCLKCPLSLVEKVNRTNWRRQNEQQGQNVLIKIACPNLLVSKCWLLCNIDFTACFMVRLSLSGTVLCTLQKGMNIVSQRTWAFLLLLFFFFAQILSKFAMASNTTVKVDCIHCKKTIAAFNVGTFCKQL